MTANWYSCPGTTASDGSKAETQGLKECILKPLLHLARSSSQRKKADQATDLTSIFLASATAPGAFGNVTVKTPLLNSAEILSRSTPSGR